MAGGQWIDQNWVSNLALREMGDGLVLKDWLKEVAIYLVLVFAFTYSLYSGRNNREKIEMKSIFVDFVQRSLQNVRWPDSLSCLVYPFDMICLFSARQTTSPSSYATLAVRRNAPPAWLSG